MVSSSSSGGASSSPLLPPAANLPAFIYLVMMAVWVSRGRVAEIRLRNAIRRENAECRRVFSDDGNRQRPYRPHQPGNINCNCLWCSALHRPLFVARTVPGSLAARRGLVTELTIENTLGEVYDPVAEAEEELRRESITRNFLDRDGFGCKSFSGRWDDGGNEDGDGDGDGVGGVVEGNLDLEFRL